jgi:hypothetical protein
MEKEIKLTKQQIIEVALNVAKRYINEDGRDGTKYSEDSNLRKLEIVSDKTNGATPDEHYNQYFIGDINENIQFIFDKYDLSQIKDIQISNTVDNIDEAINVFKWSYDMLTLLKKAISTNTEWGME